MANNKRNIKNKKKTDVVDSLAFSTTNFVLFAVGLLVIIAGWLFLGKGSITLAPILLVIGYCVIIPLALAWGLWSFKSEPDK